MTEAKIVTPHMKFLIGRPQKNVRNMCVARPSFDELTIAQQLAYYCRS